MKTKPINEIMADIKNDVNRKNLKRIKYTLEDVNNISIMVRYWNDIGNIVIPAKFDMEGKRINPYKVNNIEVIRRLIFYIHGLPQDCFDENKGILLFGNVGTGKTTYFRILEQYRKIDNVLLFNEKEKSFIPYAFLIISSRKMVQDYQENGYEGIEHYFKRTVLCIDDLGSEETISNNYGTKCEVLNEIIERRYIDGLFTHITTNLNSDSICDKYGDRVYSRLKEMCNRIEIKGIDLRC